MPINFTRTVMGCVLIAALLIGIARVTAIRWWKVPENDPDLSSSLAPSLSPGDWIVLWRLTEPGYGDLVLCPDPQEAEEVVVGRIAAKGGDSLLIREDGQLEVNNTRARSERSCKEPSVMVENPRSGDQVELPCDVETLGGVHHKRARVIPGGLKPRPMLVTVKAGDVFLVSDNRYYPFDSRDYGPVPRASCRESVLLRLVSRQGYFDSEARLSLIP
jgi:signal peptidase I